jgi:prophage regulatory protein
MYQNVREVSKRFDVAPCTIWRWVNDGFFPTPYRFGPSATRWHEDDIKKFELRSATQR